MVVSAVDDGHRGGNRAPGWLTVMRPLNMLLAFCSVLLGAYLASVFTAWEWWSVLAASVAAALILAAGNTFNDIIDQKSDSINHPNRPLVRGNLSRTGAWVIVVVCTSAGLILASQVSAVAFIVAATVCLLLVTYSLYLKSVPFFGNLSVAIMAALTFPFGGIALGSIRGTEYPGIFALLFHLGREIVKDLEDRSGDARVEVDTLAVRFGIQFPRIIVSLVLALLIVATIIPFVTRTYGLIYFLVALLGVDLLLAGMIWKLWTSEDPRSLRQISMGLKAGMVIGLVAILLG
jgi:geranylgeranylglycerol-phosphate geranylgeranyltransferase